MKLSLKKTASTRKFVLMALLSVVAAASFIYTLHACFYQWNSIVQLAAAQNIQKPLLDFVMLFFRASVVFTAISAILFGLALTFTVSLIQVAKHAHDDDLAGLV